MDPIANMTEQIEISRDINRRIEDDAAGDFSTMDRTALEAIAHDANRLVELLDALHEWRMKGGYDPYLQAGALAFLAKRVK